MALIRKHTIIIVSTFLCTGLAFNLYAQRKDTTVVDMKEQTKTLANLTAGDYARMVLPPLSYLMETAASSPKVVNLRLSKDEEAGNLKTVKRNFLSNFYVFGTYQYGQYGADVYNTTSQTGLVRQYTSQAQTVYSTGLGVTIPFELFIDRKNKIDIQRKRVKAIDSQIEDAINTQKMQIAEMYANAIQQLATLKIKAEVYSGANTQMQLVQDQYLNGNVKLGEYNSAKTAQAEAVISYESTRSDLNKAILSLEILTGVNIIKK